MFIYFYLKIYFLFPISSSLPLSLEGSTFSPPLLYLPILVELPFTWLLPYRLLLRARFLPPRLLPWQRLHLLHKFYFTCCLPAFSCRCGCYAASGRTAAHTQHQAHITTLPAALTMVSVLFSLHTSALTLLDGFTTDAATVVQPQRTAAFLFLSLCLRLNFYYLRTAHARRNLFFLPRFTCLTTRRQRRLVLFLVCGVACFKEEGRRNGTRARWRNGITYQRKTPPPLLPWDHFYRRFWIYLSSYTLIVLVTGSARHYGGSLLMDFCEHASLYYYSVFSWVGFIILSLLLFCAFVCMYAYIVPPTFETNTPRSIA